MGTLCFVALPQATAEIRRADGRIVMEEADYRLLITEIQTLKAEAAALREVVEKERAGQNEYIVRVSLERQAKEALIGAQKDRIDRLTRQKWYPGIIAGVGGTWEGEVQGVVGLGWKIDLW